LLAFCDQAKAKGTIPMIIGEKDQFPAWATVNAMTSDFLAENPTFASGLAAGTEKFTNPEYVKRIQALADLKAKGCFEDQGEAVDFSTSMKMFMDGEGAIFNCASFCIPDLIGATTPEQVNATVGLLPISYNKPALWLYGGDDSGMYLTKSGDATQESAARAYMDFALGEGYDLYLNAMHENSRYPTAYPVSDPDAVATPIREGADALAASTPAAAAIEPLLVCFPAYSDYFTLLAELYTGDKTAQAVAEGLQAGFDQTCKDLGMPGF
jgi:raffinose/stachyose/melibiose transport system substrate-binding protein